jgi:hypothetical protein
MVAGGVNDLQVQWFRNFVIPEFEARNPGVTVNLIEFGGSDEALREQRARPVGGRRRRRDGLRRLLDPRVRRGRHAPAAQTTSAVPPSTTGRVGITSRKDCRA